MRKTVFDLHLRDGSRLLIEADETHFYLTRISVGPIHQDCSNCQHSGDIKQGLANWRKDYYSMEKW